MKTQCLNNKGCQILLLIHKELISPRQYRKHKSKFFLYKNNEELSSPQEQKEKVLPSSAVCRGWNLPHKLWLADGLLSKLCFSQVGSLVGLGPSLRSSPLFIPFNIKPCFIQHRTWLPHCNPWCSLSPQTVILSFFLPYLFYHCRSVEQSLIITWHSQYYVVLKSLQPTTIVQNSSIQLLAEFFFPPLDKGRKQPDPLPKYHYSSLQYFSPLSPPELGLHSPHCSPHYDSSIFLLGWLT